MLKFAVLFRTNLAYKSNPIGKLIYNLNYDIIQLHGNLHRLILPIIIRGIPLTKISFLPFETCSKEIQLEFQNNTSY